MIIKFAAINGTLATKRILFMSAAILCPALSASTELYWPNCGFWDAEVRAQPIRARKRSSLRMQTALRRRTVMYIRLPKPKRKSIVG